MSEVWWIEHFLPYIHWNSLVSLLGMWRILRWLLRGHVLSIQRETKVMAIRFVLSHFGQVLQPRVRVVQK